MYVLFAGKRTELSALNIVLDITLNRWCSESV